MWSSMPDGVRWQLVWREEVPVTPEMQAWAEACQQQIAARIEADMAAALARMAFVVGWDVAPPGRPASAQTYAVPSSGEGLTLETIRRAREFLLPRVPGAPAASPLSGAGVYGSGEREIPDTPLAEWNAGVDALLAECAQWQTQTDALGQEP